MKIFVTGGSGMIGTKFLEFFKKKTFALHIIKIHFQFQMATN